MLFYKRTALSLNVSWMSAIGIAIPIADILEVIADIPEVITDIVEVIADIQEVITDRLNMDGL